MKAQFSGLRAWIWQRVTAVYLLGFILWFAGTLFFAPPVSYEDWYGWVRDGAPRVAILVFFLALALHAWVGLRDVAIDYIKPLGVRLAVLALVAGALAAVVLWAAAILFG